MSSLVSSAEDLAGRPRALGCLAAGAGVCCVLGSETSEGAARLGVTAASATALNVPPRMAALFCARICESPGCGRG